MAGWTFRFLGIVSQAVIVVVAVAWAAGALHFDLPTPPLIRDVAATLWLLGAIIAWFFLRPRIRARIVVMFAFFGIIGWWLTIQPRSARDWKPEVAVLADAAIDGEHVTIHNIRNFDYRTETDFTPHYDTRAYDLGRLRGLDLFVTYWGSPLIAHPILSFDFGEQGHICFSIETRSERGAAYSTVRGFYRQFELIYIPADERDVIRLRTNFRKGEEVYLYGLTLPVDQIRGRFLEYAHHLNDLRARPEWYNAISTNCTTSIRSQHEAKERMPWDWRILANGKADEMLYELGMVDRSLPFADLKRHAYINDRARSADGSEDFSELIRVGLPEPRR